jgi:methionine synthase reductase
LELLPKLQPRFYSISSSPISNPNEIKIAFNVINYELCGRIIHGLCSTWLDKLTGCVKEGCATVSINIPIFPKPRNDMILTVPDSRSVPIIMICAGTGVTPFMGLIEHIGQKYARFNVRTMTKSTNIDTAELPETWLFYGCRFTGPNGDILYRDEFQIAKELGILSKLDFSLSRETPKEYVQDKIKAHGKEILLWVMEKGAIIYVCGSLAMSKDVHACLASLFEQNGIDGTTQLLSLMTNKRYIKEIWG